jgi:hypothetical protein
MVSDGVAEQAGEAQFCYAALLRQLGVGDFALDGDFLRYFPL